MTFLLPPSALRPFEFRRVKPRLIGGWSSVVLLSMAGVIGSLAACHETLAQENGSTVVLTERECKVKYVYLYSFGLLTKWPESSFEHTDNNFVIGVLGDKPYGHILDAIAVRKKIGMRRIVIRRFKSMDEYRPCQILYVTDSVAELDVKSAAEKLKEDPVLIVGEIPDVEYFGAVVSFRIENENVKFSLNVDAVKRRHLMVSARLSRLALTVRDTDRHRAVSSTEDR
jgi:hypothetical protein